MISKHISMKIMLFLISWFLPVLVPAAAQAGSNPQEQDEDFAGSDIKISPAILNNQRLRAYFLKEYVERHYYNRSSQMMSRNFVENWIDLQISHNAEVIAERVTLLKNDYEMGSLLLARLEKEPERIDIKLQVTRFFRSFREEARSLRRKLNFLVTGLDSEPEDASRHYSIEKDSVPRRMTMVKAELVEMERLVRDYFFNPTHVVEVRDLEDNNMMIRLFRIEKIMESLEKTEF